jgi:predicted Zn-dependent protease
VPWPSPTWTYTSGLNYCFGLADGLARRAILALSRLWQSFYGRPEEVALFRERVTKEAVRGWGTSMGWGIATTGAA